MIYLEMLNNKIYPDYPPTDIQEIISVLHNQGYKEEAYKIRDLYARKGFSEKVGFEFLRLLDEKYQN